MKVLTDKERQEIARNFFAKIEGFEKLELKIQKHMIDSYALGMLAMHLLIKQEGILDLEMKINKLK